MPWAWAFPWTLAWIGICLIPSSLFLAEASGDHEISVLEGLAEELFTPFAENFQEDALPQINASHLLPSSQKLYSSSHGEILDTLILLLDNKASKRQVDSSVPVESLPCPFCPKCYPGQPCPLSCPPTPCPTCYPGSMCPVGCPATPCPPCYPGTSCPRGCPPTPCPECYPGVPCPIGCPITACPPCYPGSPCPPGCPQTACPPCYPGEKCPLGCPATPCPQCFPGTPCPPGCPLTDCPACYPGFPCPPGCPTTPCPLCYPGVPCPVGCPVLTCPECYPGSPCPAECPPTPCPPCYPGEKCPRGCPSTPCPDCVRGQPCPPGCPPGPCPPCYPGTACPVDCPVTPCPTCYPGDLCPIGCPPTPCPVCYGDTKCPAGCPVYPCPDCYPGSSCPSGCPPTPCPVCFAAGPCPPGCPRIPCPDCYPGSSCPPGCPLTPCPTCYPGDKCPGQCPVIPCPDCYPGQSCPEKCPATPCPDCYPGDVCPLGCPYTPCPSCYPGQSCPPGCPPSQAQQTGDQIPYNSSRPVSQSHISNSQEGPKVAAVFEFKEEDAQKTDQNQGGNKMLEPGKAALADKLHKKLNRAESTESLVVKKETVTESPVPKKEEVPEEKDEWASGFDKLLEDLASNPEGVTSKKSKTLGARYLQKVQIQHAIDNDLIAPPPAAILEEEDESEPEPPVKFRGKFKSIKDKKVERVILTYASHSDESATEMIPDEDASDFEEELKREIRSKDKKRGHFKKPRGDSSSGSESGRKDNDRRKSGGRGKNKENKPNNKQDSDYSVSSSSESDSSSSLSSDDSDSDDSESEELVRPRRKGKQDSDSDVGRKKPKRRGRKWDSDSSDSEEEIIPRRRTRRRRKSSSDEDSYKPVQRSRKRKKKQDSSDSEEVSLKTRRGKKKNKSESEEEEFVSTRRGRKKGRVPNRKKKNRQREDSDDESEDEKALPRKTRGMKKKQQETKNRKRRKESTSVSSSSDSDEENSSKTKKEMDQRKKGNIKKGRKILEDSSEDSELPAKNKNHKKSSLIVDSDDSDEDSKKETKEPDEEKIEDKVDEEQKAECSVKAGTENEAKEGETQAEEDTLDLIEDIESNLEGDSVIEKLNKMRNEELNREDVLEMKAWFGEVNNDIKKQLCNLQEMGFRNNWKKPQFGVGDDFLHGWQTDVKKYKEYTARFPKKLCHSVKHQETSSSKGTSRKGRDRDSGKDSPSRQGSSSPAKNTRSKSGIIKTSMAVAEDDKLKVASRPEISSVMQRFFEKVLADSANDVMSKGSLASKKFNLGPFPAYGAQRVPTGLTPTPSVAPSMLASDDSDLDSLASIRTDLPASDSVPVSKRSIASSLLKKIGRKYNDKKLNTLCLGKPRNILEATNKPQLLPTPGMPTTEKELENMEPNEMKIATFFRKETVSNYRDNFEVVVTKNGINEFTQILYQSRTRTKTKQIQDAATVRSVFGADIPPHLLKKAELKKAKKTLLKKGGKKDEGKAKEDSSPVPVSRASTPGGSLQAAGDEDDDSELRSERSESVLGESSAPSVTKKARRKFRKFRSGFDYIRKKKKVKPDDEATPSRKRLPVRKHVNWPEESRDVAAEVRSWVVNKGLGETVLHKAARLQYHDVVVYCAESPDFDINVRDNAGYTPLHEACNRGHLDIAQVLCSHGAHVNAPGYKGMRPLHEAVENGHAELARLLLAYGADPMLTTYAGQTCFDLCADIQCTQLLEGFLADLKGHDGEMWHFAGPTRLSDPEEQGCDIFGMIPAPSCNKTTSEDNVESSQDADLKATSDSVTSRNVTVDEADKGQKLEKERAGKEEASSLEGKCIQSLSDKELSVSGGEIVKDKSSIKEEPKSVEVKMESDTNMTAELSSEKKMLSSEEVNKKDEEINEQKEDSDMEDGWDMQVVFEICELPLLDTYEVEGQPHKYLLLMELLKHLKVTQEELIIAAKTIETLELSPEEFEKRAHCCIVGSCSRALVDDCSSVVLVKITPSLEKLLGIETVKL